MAILDISLPSAKQGAHIGLLGGSFDPPHLCHELLALSFLALEPIDELWVIPCGDHAFKNIASNFAHRLAMCEIAFRRILNVRVLDLESKLKAPSYTVETVGFILANRPDLSLHLGIGSDLVQSFETWHRPKKIVEQASIAIFERQSYSITSLPEVLKSARVHKGYALPDINSTSLREFFRTQNKTSCSFVDREVARYIERAGLYKIPNCSAGG